MSDFFTRQEIRSALTVIPEASGYPLTNDVVKPAGFRATARYATRLSAARILEKTISAESDLLPAFDWVVPPDAVRSASRMLLIHQVGSVRIGEVVR